MTHAYDTAGTPSSGLLTIAVFLLRSVRVRASRRPVQCPLLPTNPGEKSLPERGDDYVGEASFPCGSLALETPVTPGQLPAAGGYVASVCDSSAVPSARKNVCAQELGQRVCRLATSTYAACSFAPCYEPHARGLIPTDNPASRPVSRDCLLPTTRPIHAWWRARSGQPHRPGCMLR
jgi:hypothetical protein